MSPCRFLFFPDMLLEASRWSLCASVNHSSSPCCLYFNNQAMETRAWDHMMRTHKQKNTHIHTQTFHSCFALVGFEKIHKFLNINFFRNSDLRCEMMKLQLCKRNTTCKLSPSGIIINDVSHDPFSCSSFKIYWCKCV